MASIADEAVPPTLDVTPYIDRVQHLFNSSKRHDLIATAGVFLIGIALAWFLGVRVTRPVDEVVYGFQRLAEGDFEARVPERPGEEFGHLGRQFNTMVERLYEGRELERQLEQRERIQHMGDLAAGVAHDVRNPLNAIHLNIGQIRDEFLPAEERARERFLRFTSDVQREVERLNQLVTNFLSLARPAGREAESVDPNELADELYRLLRKEATGRDVELALDLTDGLPPCSWNRQEMKSAFLNIAINALQALVEKGGHLVISTARRAGRHGEELVVSFADDGPGIPPEDLERVFVPYYTTRKGGTGLGMAIARRTAERHGGRIELASTVGDGTTVSFVFPSQSREEAA
jgi:signal transduction histidine kinase